MRRLISGQAGRSISIPFTRPTLKRTHLSHELSRKDVGTKVRVSGWLGHFQLRKDNRAFVELREAGGRVRLVVQELPDHVPRTSSFSYAELTGELSKLPMESTITAEGYVKERHVRIPEGIEVIPADDYEIIVENFEVHNLADENLPFHPSSRAASKSSTLTAALRTQFRYIDLRGSKLTENIRKRHQVAQSIRQSLLQEDFVEVETPILLRSSPEGAREFLVPTRIQSSFSSSPPEVLDSAPIRSQFLEGDSISYPEHHGYIRPSPSKSKFYALAQSPQQPKQVLIASGCVEKYFQFARCFRDEDGRKDRQPEFTQVDLERAWVSWGPTPEDEARGWRIGGQEVRDTIEGLVRRVWRDVLDVELPAKFQVMTYQDAMARFGSDKPDLRFGLEISTFKHSLKAEYHIDYLVLPYAEFRSTLKSLDLKSLEHPTFQIVRIGSDGTSNVTWSEEFRAAAESGVIDLGPLNLSPGSIAYLNLRKGPFQGGLTALGSLRLMLMNKAKLLNFQRSMDPHFVWITEFPLFTRADGDKDALLARGRWSSSHHPFTAPMWEDMDHLMNGNYVSVRGQHYDLVMNGMEIGGGSVRIHDADLQEMVLKDVLELSEFEREPFNTILRALRSGAPPHGGIALGFDRLMAIICRSSSIRDVIAFPKTLGGIDPLFQSPSVVNDESLGMYGLRST